ncbi:MAG: ATP-binding protein [Bryobacteraceae bacterium]|nr:ATP-binding protein [Bryobacteraceae bacterium]
MRHLVRYGIATGIALGAMALRLLLEPVLGDRVPFVTFFLANAVSAYALRLGPALWTMTLGVAAARGFVIPGVTDLPSVLAYYSLYLLTSSVTIVAIAGQRKSAEAERRRYEQLVLETSARRKAEREQQRQREWAKATLASIGDAVITTDAEGRVTFMNSVAEQLTGWTSGEWAGAALTEVFRIVNEETGEPASNPVEKVLSTGATQGLANHTALLARDGTRRPIDDSAAPIRDEDGELIGVVLVFRDIAERRAKEEALRRSNEDLETFAYAASHDLQEPLRMVSTFMELLESKYANRLDEDARKYIGFAVNGARRMRMLIADLLEFSRAGAQLNLTRVSLETVLQSVTSTLATAIAESHALITHDPLPEVLADEMKVGRVLQNLIANAIKFRGEAAPAIHVGARREGLAWTIFVRDNGIGFDPQYASRIFRMFERLEPASRPSGSGIGLAVSKRIVEAHGGRMWCESEPGRGSTFSFTLPQGV